MARLWPSWYEQSSRQEVFLVDSTSRLTYHKPFPDHDHRNISFPAKSYEFLFHGFHAKYIFLVPQHRHLVVVYNTKRLSSWWNAANIMASHILPEFSSPSPHKTKTRRLRPFLFNATLPRTLHPGHGPMNH